MTSYKIAYATGSRADYGIVRRYLHLLNDDEHIRLSILVTGAHLADSFGSSVRQIQDDGFHIAKQVPLDLTRLNPAHLIEEMAEVLRQFGIFFAEERYDLVIILGDRYEMLPVAIAAAMNNTPILHLHGGELTQGNQDDFIRHSITKMSRFHFTATEEYRRRVIQMGEEPDTVFNMGALGAENCLLYDRDKVSSAVQALKETPYVVVAFHPETASGEDPLKQITELLDAIDEFADQYPPVFIGVNADSGATAIREAVSQYVLRRHCVYFENLNSESYMELIKNARILIGNSSSGIIEAPTLGTYTLNIGHRQDGRTRADSVVDVPCEREWIARAIGDLISRPLPSCVNPYYQEHTAQNYYRQTLACLQNPQRQKPKKFYDLHQSEE